MLNGDTTLCYSGGMIAAPLLAGLILVQAPAGLGFGEALARAERYDKDPKAEAFRANTLDGFLDGRMEPLFAKCEAGMTAPQRFTLVISFKAGRFDRIERNDDGPVAQCMADAFETFPYPAPPYDDFAEEVRMTLTGGQ
jgi:hypothetical protein